MEISGQRALTKQKIKVFNRCSYKKKIERNLHILYRGRTVSCFPPNWVYFFVKYLKRQPLTVKLKRESF